MNTLNPGQAYLLGLRVAEIAEPAVNRSNLEALAVDCQEPEIKETRRWALSTLANLDAYAARTYNDLLERAERFGMTLPPLPPAMGTDPGRAHLAWVRTVSAICRKAAQATGDRPTMAAFEAGALAGDLGLAIATADFLLLLRSNGTENPVLETRAAAAAGTIVENAGMLFEALADEGVPHTVARPVEKLRELMARTPDASARSTTESKAAFWQWNLAVSEQLSDLFPCFDYPPELPVTGPPTEEERALLVEVAARPRDNAPRLRFAELAALRNDPRAELITLQMKMRELVLKKTPGGSSFTDRQRVKALGRFHPEWWEELLPLGVKTVRYIRGFVGSIEIDAADFVQNAEAIFRLVPVEHVHLHRVTGHLEQVAACPHLERLRSLVLNGNDLHDADIAILASSPFVGNLRVLLLDDTLLTNAGVETIAASPNFRSLLALSVNQNRCDSPVDRHESFDEFSVRFYWVATDFGQALEAKYGPKRYFHPEQWPLEEEWPL